jgi:hypothetical protein
MDLTPSSRFSWRDLIRPGSLIGFAGLVVLAVCVAMYAWSNHNVDLMANPELMAPGHGVKLMMWILLGIALAIVGGLVTFLDFQRR